MRSLVEFAMRGRWQAVAVTVACVLTVTLLPPPANAAAFVLAMLVAGFAVYASGAVVALATLRFGAVEGALVGLGALLAAGLVALLVVRGVGQVVVLGVVNWLPALIGAAVLRQRPDQGAALAATAGLFVVGWALFVGIYGEPGVLLEPWLEQQWSALSEALGEAGANTSTGAEPDLRATANGIAELLLAGLVMGVILTLLMARWWHAMLDNPGGFGKEFHALRLPRWLAVCTAVLLAGTALGGSGALGALLGGWLRVAMVLFMFQGVALVHALVKRRGGGRGWIVAMYLFISMMLPYAMVVLAMVGLVDSWFDYRRRAARG